MRADLDGITTPQTPTIPLHLGSARQRRHHAAMTAIAIMAVAVTVALLLALLANLLSFTTF